MIMKNFHLIMKCFMFVFCVLKISNLFKLLSDSFCLNFIKIIVSVAIIILKLILINTVKQKNILSQLKYLRLELEYIHIASN